MKIGDCVLDLSTPMVMTILNVTPDSFFAQSRTQVQSEIERAVERAVDEGAAIIDVGGYSSRPGAADVAVDEEIRRVACGVEAVRRIAPNMPVSIDTFRAEVVRSVVDNFGMCVVNDISAGELDADMLATVACYGAPYIAMHMRANPATMQQHSQYKDVVGDVLSYFRTKLLQLHEAGIEQVVVDPGFGFAKQPMQNFELLGGLDRFAELDAPLLVGVSRKSMIYRTLECTPEESLVGTSVLHWEALAKGAKILRVHDTLAAAQVIKLYETYKKA